MGNIALNKNSDNNLNNNISDVMYNKIYDIKFINGAAGIEPYRDVWNLLATHPHVDYDFYNMFISSRPEVLHPTLVLILLNNQVKGMVVGRMEDRYIDMKFGYKTIIKLKAKVLNISYKGFLGELNGDSLDMYINNITTFMQLNNIDLVSFDHISIDSNLYQLAIKKPSFLSRDYIRKKEFHWSMIVPGTMAEFYKGRTIKSRQNLKYIINRVNKKFIVTYETFTDESNIDKLFNDAEVVAKHTYQRGLGVGFDRSKENDNRIKFMAKSGWLRAYVLYLNAIPCSFAIGSLYKGTLYLNFIGYNPEYNKLRHKLA